MSAERLRCDTSSPTCLRFSIPRRRGLNGTRTTGKTIFATFWRLRGDPFVWRVPFTVVGSTPRMLSRRVTGLLLLACLAFFCSPALAFDAFGAGVDPHPASPWAVALQKVGAVPDAIVHPGSPSAVPSSTTPVAALFGDSKSFAISTAAHLRNLLADFAVNL